MTDPKPVADVIAGIFDRRGINPDDIPEYADDDPYSRQELIRAAREYADKNIPARYADARADDMAVVNWIRRLLDQAVADSVSRRLVTVHTGPSLLILGVTGVGKTHQAFGALRLLAETGARCAWKAVTAADMYARLRPRHGVDHETEFRSLANAPLLLLDDLGAAKTSEWVEEVNYRLVNWRYERVLPTLFTSNVRPKELSSSLGERVASRLIEMAERVVLEGPDRLAGERVMGEEMEPGIRRRIGRNPHLSQVQVGGETMNEMFGRVDAEFRERRRFYADGVIADIRWYGWRLNPAELTLALVDSTDWPTYTLPLRDCDQSAQILNWLIQVSGKAWREYDIEKVTVGLLRALDDIFQPQATMCSFGRHTTLTDQQLRDRVATFTQMFHEGEQP